MQDFRPDRYQKMLYRKMGKSGLLFPAISLGLWHNFGDDCDPSVMRDLLCQAFDLGICHFDLANNYGPPYGAAERNAGSILRQEFANHRDELIISTKAGYEMWPGPYGNGGSRKYLIASIDQSLRRLGLDYVDLFYHHRPDPETPLEETMYALKSIVDSGKALYVGISNYNREQTAAAYKWARKLHLPLIVNQRRYSLFDRQIERQNLPAELDSNGMGMIAFSPLAQGLLSDRYRGQIPSDSRIVRDGRYLKREDWTKEKQDAVEALAVIAKERGQSLSQMALAWDLRLPCMSSVIIGASKPSQLHENVKALDSLDFSQEELDRIDQIVG